MSVPLRPEFSEETVENPGRGGWAVTASGRSIRIRTTYAEVHTAWELEHVVEEGRLVSAATGAPLDTHPGYAGLSGWDVGRAVGRCLFALDPTGRLYVGDATALSPDAVAWAEGRPGLPEIRVWHHSSFVSGGPVLCAGDLATDTTGRLRRISNWSGHYKPGPETLATALRVLRDQGLPLAGVWADVVGRDGVIRVVDAEALADAGTDTALPDHGATVRRQEAIALVCRMGSTTWSQEREDRLTRWVTAGLAAADPTQFDPADPVHWNWLVRWAVEGTEP